jgi:hypothetical protein
MNGPELGLGVTWLTDSGPWLVLVITGVFLPSFVKKIK